MIVSGEPLSPRLVDDFKRVAPNACLLNAYGTSEVAGLACMGEVTSSNEITVGRPMPGFQVHVLDEELRPVFGDAVGRYTSAVCSLRAVTGVSLGSRPSGSLTIDSTLSTAPGCTEPATSRNTRQTAVYEFLGDAILRRRCRGSSQPRRDRKRARALPGC